MAQEKEEKDLPKVIVTERERAPDDKSVLETKRGTDDIQVVVVTWYKQALIRTVRTYLQSLLGFIVAVGSGAAGAVGINIPMQDFGQLFLSSASLAIAPAIISLLQNAVELLTRLDSTSPQMRA